MNRPPTDAEILDMLKQYQVISIIGLEKNVGKTTTLNYLVEIARSGGTLGLTSIGLDGEPYDAVFELPKPRIFVTMGTLFATAHQALQSADVSLEILDVTPFMTPLGEIIIAKALTAGFIELAGPSTSHEMKRVIGLLQNMGAEVILVDGAVNRRSFATPAVTNATILVSGANVSDNFAQFVQETEFAYQILSLPASTDQIMIQKSQHIAHFGVITSQGESIDYPVLTALDIPPEIVAQIPAQPACVVVNGAFSSELFGLLFSNFDPEHPMAILVPDSTKVFLLPEDYRQLHKTQWKLLVRVPITLLFLAVNPTSTFGYAYDPAKSLQEIRSRVPLPVIDVIGGG